MVIPPLCKREAVVLIPAYNEEHRIEKTVLETRRYVDDIIVVDDGSLDKTASIAKKAGADVISYRTNRGIGHAVKLGLRKALDLDPGIVVFMDADGQHDPRYIPNFIKAIEDGADYVYGKRDFSNYPFDRKIGNLGLTFLTNMLCPTGIMDVESGYRALTTEAVRKMDLKADGYAIAMDFAYSAWKNKLNIDKVDVIVPVFHPKPAIKRGLEDCRHFCGRVLNP